MWEEAADEDGQEASLDMKSEDVLMNIILLHLQRTEDTFLVSF